MSMVCLRVKSWGGPHTSSWSRRLGTELDLCDEPPSQLSSGSSSLLSLTSTCKNEFFIDHRHWKSLLWATLASGTGANWGVSTRDGMNRSLMVLRCRWPVASSPRQAALVSWRCGACGRGLLHTRQFGRGADARGPPAPPPPHVPPWPGLTPLPSSAGKKRCEFGGSIRGAVGSPFVSTGPGACGRPWVWCARAMVPMGGPWCGTTSGGSAWGQAATGTLSRSKCSHCECTGPSPTVSLKRQLRSSSQLKSWLRRRDRRLMHIRESVCTSCGRRSSTWCIMLAASDCTTPLHASGGTAANPLRRCRRAVGSRDSCLVRTSLPMERKSVSLPGMWTIA
mmetsp:Transcript_30427/g.85810  ORF Transcript_30427/g.85810 Transcript_30427/m.85810 type:complete len:337 (-) Transcript_30427:710-1720(-)